MSHSKPQFPTHVAVLALALAVAGLAGCDEPPPTSPSGPASPGASASRAADSLGTTTTRPPKSFYVDPVKGKDTNSGTKLLPFKTLARALGSALGRDTVHLASGEYSKAANGEKFSVLGQLVPVRPGVVITGTAGQVLTTRLVGGGGPSETGLYFQGGVVVKNIILKGFTVGVTPIGASKS